MADLSPPPDGNTTIAPLINISCTILLSVAVAIYGLRMYIRFKNLSLEDYTISMAVAISLTEIALVWQASQYGYGRHNYYVSDEDKTAVYRYLFGIVIVGLWSATLIRSISRLHAAKTQRHADLDNPSANNHHYPGCHDGGRQYLPATAVPSHSCNVGYGSRGPVLDRPPDGNIWECVCKPGRCMRHTLHHDDTLLHQDTPPTAPREDTSRIPDEPRDAYQRSCDS